MNGGKKKKQKSEIKRAKFYDKVKQQLEKRRKQKTWN